MRVVLVAGVLGAVAVDLVAPAKAPGRGGIVGGWPARTDDIGRFSAWGMFPSEPLLIDPALLEDPLATRTYLMRVCLETRAFLGLGTGLGSALVVDGVLAPMELAHLPFRKGEYEDYVGLRGYEKYGKKKWRKSVAEVVARKEPPLATPSLPVVAL